jgi:sporulation protein YlmC with PRC-barrel domain
VNAKEAVMNIPLIDIPMDVEVKCCGRNCGRSTHIVLNPVTKEITHLVVKTRAFPHTERLVPVDLIAESTPRIVHLRCDAPALNVMDEFVEAEFINSEDMHINEGPFMMWPYISATEEFMPQEHERIPVGELAIRRGAHVEARDGQVGRVDEFVVDRRSEHITHLVIREGQLWDQQDITIPVCYIDHIDEDVVYLNIDKASIAALPMVPVYISQRSTK